MLKNQNLSVEELELEVKTHSQNSNEKEALCHTLVQRHTGVTGLLPKFRGN